MKRAGLIITAIAAALFLASWFIKGMTIEGENPVSQGFWVTLSAFLTLCIFSFLYKDNPFYKFAEHLFVGVSAAYWMTMGFWTTFVPNLFPRISEGLSSAFKVAYAGFDPFYLIPVVLGILLLMRLSSSHGWLARWPLAFIVGTTSGLYFTAALRSNFMEQISSTFLPLVTDWQGFGAFFSNFSLSATGQFAAMLANWVIFTGVICGLIYFFFSREHSGLFGRASRFGIWILMITFGASFGYTVMGRISLLVGRISFLLRDWLNAIN
ncbi:MAG: hypothetical protein SGI97_02800 [candidate division Zixibacteria bacterium]|nr:hypothetical protein [candidate division Zixibacteria bacterium]